MDSDDGQIRSPAPRAAAANASGTDPGGSVEPANRAAVAKERFQTPVDVEGERYEMRDPLAEVTYRANSWADIAAKAAQLGSTRITAVDAQGTRTPMRLVDGQWLREAQSLPARAPLLEPAGPDESGRRPADEAREAPPRTVEAAATALPAGSASSAAPAALAKIDAEADRVAQVARIEAALLDRYLIKRAPVTVGDMNLGRTEYRFRGDTSRVAFTETTFRLATDQNSPTVARSMVDVAEARNWRGLRVSGNEDFRRMVWLEASARGVKAIGYEPNPVDLELLAKERESRLVNRIEPSRRLAGDTPGMAATDKGSARGGGRKAVLVAIEALLVAKGVSPKQREAVLAAASEKLAQRQREGQTLKVKVYDKAAPSQRTPVVPVPEQQRSRERAAPTR